MRKAKRFERRRNHHDVPGCLLLLSLLTGSVPAHSQVFDRQWQEMSMEDVYTYSMSWAPGKSTCSILEGNGPIANYHTRCNLALVAGGAPLRMTFSVNWNEPGALPACDCRPEMQDADHIWHHPHRSMFFFTPDTMVARIQGDWDAFLEAYPKDEVFEVYQDIARKLQYFAVECDCGGEDIPPRDGQEGPAPSDGSAITDQFDDLEQAEPPGPGLEDSDQVLGQGEALREPAKREFSNEDFDQFLSELAKTRKLEQVDAPAGMPAGTRVESVKLFASPKGLPPRESRQYREVFTSDVQYINFELNLSFPEVQQRHDFDLAINITRDGEQLVRIESVGYSLEPGWIRSHHEAGYGKPDGQYWKPGNYRYTVLADGFELARGSFTVVTSD